MNQQTTLPTSSNGESAVHDLFALTDEQILEIEPESATTADQSSQTTNRDVIPSERSESRDRCNTIEHLPPESTRQGASAAPRPVTGTPVGMTNDKAASGQEAEPPQWVAEAMNDPRQGGEARAFWEGAQKAQQDAAAYREVFAKPEDARTAAGRARLLDDIDRAYFAGDGNQRAQLAAVMLREDPAAFREMVFVGLRALDEAGSAAAATGRNETTVHAQLPPGQDSSTAGRANGGPSLGMTNPGDAQVAAYATFEKAANEDLERSVGSAIARTIEQVVPNLKPSDERAAPGARNTMPLQERLSAAVRQDVEQALKNDRQLGEQIAQLLSARRFDGETRAQVVRLIGERAKQLVPGAAKRVLQDWTQTTLAAHRSQSQRTERNASRADLTPAESQAASSRLRPDENRRDSARKDDGGNRPGKVDYRKLSDEQILEM